MKISYLSILSFFILWFCLASSSLAQSGSTDCPAQINLDDLGSGVAARDNATGNGYIMWSAQTVQQRFSPPALSSNASHLISVVYDEGQWFADNNSSLVPFSPNSRDCLLAAVDFDNDTVQPLTTPNTSFFGIDSGFTNSDLIIHPNQWNNSPNNGEFFVTGSFLEFSTTQSPVTTSCPSQISLDNLGSGIAARDNATGTGFIMWSAQTVQQRFGPSTHPSNAAQLISVVYDSGQWFVDNNSTLLAFSPNSDDCLLATVDFDNDSVQLLTLPDTSFFGIDSGFTNSDLVIHPNQWNNSPNNGEFFVTGSFLENSTTQSFDTTNCPSQISLGNLGSGIAARDNATGSGYIMWSAQTVQQRFSPATILSNASHLISAVYEGGQWYVDNNSSLIAFSPNSDDCLLATVDFDSDSVQLLTTPDTSFFGIDSGFTNSDLIIHPNQWNNSPNNGEFFVTGSFLNNASAARLPNLSDYSLVFRDEFSGSTLDPTKWDTALLWGPYFPINNEEQLYVDTLGMHSSETHSPFELTGATLKITATAVSDSVPVPPRPDFFFSDGSRNPIWKPNDYSEYRFNGPYTDDNGNFFPGYEPEDVNYLSGIITSYDSFKMTHGYVETRAKVPAGRGLWPAFWLLTTHYVEDVPEIDVMEFLGQDVDTLYNTYHYFDVEDNYRKISTPSFQVFADDWTQDFHIFGMAWSPNEIIWYVDGKETHRVTDSEYVIANQAMYLIANMAVGGNWPGSPDADTQFPATFEIDYIRAYERRLDPVLNLDEDYTLQFFDEFDGAALDPEKWNTHLLWGPYLTINREEQYYVDALGSDAERTTSANTPFVMDNGMLSITARAKDDTNSVSVPDSLPGLDDPIWRDYRSFARNPGYSPEDLNYTSGIITSYDAFKFSYGYAEAKMRLPNGSGLWPAFWLLNGYYVGEQPEIDIIEARGGVPDRISHNFYTNNGGLNPSDGETQHPDPINGYQADFHLYGVRWRPGRIDWYIDREIVHTYITSDAGPVPYQNMYVIANLATGGDFFVHPNDPYRSPINDPSDFPAKLDIDYIRVWQEKHKE